MSGTKVRTEVTRGAQRRYFGRIFKASLEQNTESKPKQELIKTQRVFIGLPPYGIDNLHLSAEGAKGDYQLLYTWTSANKGIFQPEYRQAILSVSKTSELSLLATFLPRL